MRRALLVGLGALGCLAPLVCLPACVRAQADIDDPDFLITEAVAWQLELRSEHRGSGRPLSEEETRALAGYFAPELLTEVRVVDLPKLPNPGFYVHFESAGRPVPIDFSRMAALGTLDTVFLARSRIGAGRPSAALLFHELVHLAQDQMLGIEASTRLYVESWLEQGEYRDIPHEAQAYELARRFSRGERFKVGDAVAERFGAAE